MPYEYLMVVDFEANCIRNGTINPQEITEFPAIPIKINSKQILHDKTFHHYCKIDTPVTDYATELTGITQDMCDKGTPFKRVLDLFKTWLYDNGFNEDNSILVTCGDWDFKKMMPSQCRYSKIKVPKYCKSWCNVKRVFEQVYKIKAGSFKNMLEITNIELEGRHHSGIDDTRNIAKICVRLLQKGGEFKSAL